MFFAGIEGLPSAYIWSGIIWCLVLGAAAGNYACSLVHRLPRGRFLLDKKPYCGSCGELLQVRDLFPIISAVMLRHRCRYCGESYPVSHTVTEIIMAGIFVFSFLRFGFGDMMVLLLLLSAFWIIISAIEVNDNIIMGKIIASIAVCGMLLRVYADGQLFNFVLGSLFGAILGAVVWRKGIERVGHIYRLPQQAELMAVSGICVGAANFPLFLIIFVLSHATLWSLSQLLRKGRNYITISFSFAVFVTLFFVL